LQMPGSDGFVFLDRLQQYEQPPAVVVSSGLATVENAVKAVRLGAKDFIVKPFKVEQLLQTIERTLTIEALTAELSDLQMVRSVLELSTAVLSVTEVEPLLERLADLLWNLFKPEAIFFFIRSSETANFILRKYRPQPQPERISLFLSEEEVKKELGGERVGMKELSGKRQLLALLQGQGRELGVVRFDFPAERPGLTEKEQSFLSGLLVQSGIALENAMLFQALNEAYLKTIRSLVNSLEARDAYTRGHSEQVAYYAVLIGRQMKLSERQLEILRNIGYLHDLGKLGIKDAILLKEGKLTPEEYQIIREHPRLTARILEPLTLEEGELEACLYHHEWFNGRGYPAGLKEDQIPLMARIIAVADAYSAMTSNRPYSRVRTREEALAELKRCRGSQFDASVVDAFVSLMEGNEPPPTKFAPKEISGL
ncbi:MAG TPA: HD domain-containing phosphohydrolase, partial [bacterium]|nr:HD domain-containing phosphohydrolase [bacterium]